MYKDYFYLKSEKMLYGNMKTVNTAAVSKTEVVRCAIFGTTTVNINTEMPTQL